MPAAFGAEAVSQRSIEPFPRPRDTTVLGHFDFQFYGSAAERRYSAQAALLLLNLIRNHKTHFGSTRPPDPCFPESPVLPRRGSLFRAPRGRPARNAALPRTPFSCY